MIPTGVAATCARCARLTVPASRFCQRHHAGATRSALKRHPERATRPVGVPESPLLDRPSLAILLRTAMERHGLSRQVDIAAALHVGRTTITEWLHGRSRPLGPTYLRLLTLAGAFPAAPVAPPAVVPVIPPPSRVDGCLSIGPGELTVRQRPADGAWYAVYRDVVGVGMSVVAAIDDLHAVLRA